MKKNYLPGLIFTFLIALAAYFIAYIFPTAFLGESLIALVLGMLLNPLLNRKKDLNSGVDFTSSIILKVGIILAGISLSFTQVVQAGKYALILLVFTFATAFGVAYIVRRIFNIDWKLASLLSVSTAICGGTAVATVGPTIKAKDKDIAYAISATFLFDMITVLLFPLIGQLLGMTDQGYGLWIGTSVNDTSSVVAAGYAFSDSAGALATIVKLTRTLFIVPITLVFAYIYAKKEAKRISSDKTKVNLVKIFPWFILGFLAMVALRTTGILPENIVKTLSFISKFLMAMALAGVGAKTSLAEIKDIGPIPMIAGIIIDSSVVVVAYFAQDWILKLL